MTSAPDASPARRLNRRAFLSSLGASAFVLGFAVPAHRAVAETPASGRVRVNAFLAIGSDNTVRAVIAQAEMGQGITTELTQVLADELGAEWRATDFSFSTEPLPEFVNPILYSGQTITGGSTSMRGFYLAVRTAAASAREMLIAAAAQSWGVGADEVVAEASQLRHVNSQRRMRFADAAASAADLPVPEQPRLKERAALTLTGRPLKRLDIADKVTGAARFGIDHSVPGMLWAAVRHGEIMGVDPIRIDASAAEATPGVRRVMLVPQGVAVVAEHYWQAKTALDTVRVEYPSDARATATTDTVLDQMQAALDKPGVAAPGGRGDAIAAIADAARVLEAEFTLPHLAHACIEPVSCTAHVTGDRCALWLSTQSPSVDADHAAKALGVDPSRISVHNEFMGGAFGRRTGREHVTEAVLLSKAVGAPVKVVWSREEDLLVDQFRTAAMGRVRLGLDAEGRPVGYHAKLAAGGMWASLFPEWYATTKPLDVPMFGLVGSPYAIPHETGEFAAVEMPVRTGAWRGNSHNHNLFFLDTMLDEAAAETSRDPLAYRLSLLEDPRSRAVIERAAQRANWGAPSQGRFQGVAFLNEPRLWNTRVAAIVEISSVADALKVERIVCVCDSGLVVNPLLARQNIEGGLLFGLSAAMREAITLSGGAPEQRNFDGYELLRIDQAPTLDIEIVEGGEDVGSFGEVATPVVAPALGNAIFAATGRRIRSTPFAAHGVEFV